MCVCERSGCLPQVNRLIVLFLMYRDCDENLSCWDLFCFGSSQKVSETLEFSAQECRGGLIVEDRGGENLQHEGNKGKGKMELRYEISHFSSGQGERS